MSIIIHNVYTACHNIHMFMFHISYSILSFPFYHSIEMTRLGDNDKAADSSTIQQSLFNELQGCSSSEGFEPMRGNVIIL